MQKFLPLVAAGLLLAGCSDDSSNPWATDSDKSQQRVAIAAQNSPDGRQVVGTPTSETPLAAPREYPWTGKTTAGSDSASSAPKLEAGKAKVLAIRGDAGIILIKCVDMPAAGERIVITKDGKALALAVFSVAGDEVAANILPRQVDTPEITIGEIIGCRRLGAEETK